MAKSKKKAESSQKSKDKQKKSSSKSVPKSSASQNKKKPIGGHSTGYTPSGGVTMLSVTNPSMEFTAIEDPIIPGSYTVNIDVEADLVPPAPSTGTLIGQMVMAQAIIEKVGVPNQQVATIDMNLKAGIRYRTSMTWTMSGFSSGDQFVARCEAVWMLTVKEKSLDTAPETIP